MEKKKRKKEKRLAGTEENLVVRVWEVKLWNRMFVVVRFPERQMRWDSRPSRTPRCPQVGPARVSIGPDWSGISHIIRPIFSIARPAHLLPLPSPRPPRLPTCLKPLPAYWPKSVDFERTHQPLRRLTCQDTSSGSSLMWFFVLWTLYLSRFSFSQVEYQRHVHGITIFIRRAARRLFSSGCRAVSGSFWRGTLLLHSSSDLDLPIRLLSSFWRLQSHDK